MTQEEKRDLVVRLAERVMGWRIRHVGRKVLADEYEDGIGCVATWRLTDEGSVRRWNPLENIADAWMLVEALQTRFRRVEVHAVEGTYHCMIASGTNDVDECYPYCAEAETASLAICLAADNEVTR